MASAFTVVKFLWNAARAVGALRAARAADTAFDLGKSIARLAQQLRSGNRTIRDLGGPDATEEDLTEAQKDQLAQLLAQEGVTFRVQREDFRCDHSDDFR